MKRFQVFIVIALILAVAPATYGAILTIDLNTEFSGATPPQGSTPWLRATFDDSVGGANTVRLTMEALNLTGSEFVSEWNFNFNPILDPTQLTFSSVDTSAVGTTTINTGADLFKADGDGFFDIQFDFPPPPGSFPDKFTAGETVTYDITYTSSITASSFDFPSAPGGGNGTFRSAAHVQGIGQDGNLSGWIGDSSIPGPNPQQEVVPEPSSLLIWGIGLLACAGCGQFWRCRQLSVG